MTNNVIREYFCTKCDGFFEVIHSSEEMRNKFCTSCGNPVTETGMTKTVEGDWIVVRNRGVLVERYLRKDLFLKKEKLDTFPVH